MRRYTYVTTCLVAIVCNVMAVGAADDGQQSNIDNVNAKSPVYNTHIAQSRASFGECVEEVAIKGKGIDDTIQEHCGVNYRSIISTDKVLVIGHPDKDIFSIFSEMPSTLMIVKGDKCDRIKYSSSGEKTTRDMSENDCKRVRGRIIEELKNTGNVRRIYIPPPLAISNTPLEPYESDESGEADGHRWNYLVGQNGKPGLSLGLGKTGISTSVSGGFGLPSLNLGLGKTGVSAGISGGSFLPSLSLGLSKTGISSSISTGSGASAVSVSINRPGGSKKNV